MARDTLTADQIVAAAIELLDEEGLEGLNMRRLGERLGSAATAIYWHIKTKDDLLRLAGDAIWLEVDLPPMDDWRAAATAMATGMHAMLTRHPWLGQAVGSHLIYGPGKFRCDQHSLAISERAGFSPVDADRAAATVFMFVLGSSLSPAAEVALRRRLGRNGQDPEKAIGDALAKATEVAREFPMLRARLETVAATDYYAAPESSFEFGLRAILDGFAARLG